MAGTKLVFPGPKMGDAETLVDLMNSEGVTMAAGVPTVWTLLLNYLAQSGKQGPDADARRWSAARPCRSA